MRKLKDDYLPERKPVLVSQTNFKPMSQRIEEHFMPTNTALRLQQLIAYFSQLQGEAVDAEWVTKFCIDQIYKDTHTPHANTGKCRVFSRI